MASNARTLSVGTFDVTKWTGAPLRLERTAWLPATQTATFALLANHTELPKVLRGFIRS